MKAIKIDVEKQEVYEVELDEDTPQGTQLDSIYKHLGADCFCIGVRLGRYDYMVVDDNGLYRTPAQINGVFMIDGQPQPLVGHGLVLGNDDQGEAQDVSVSVELVKESVQFLPKDAILPYLLK